MNIRDVEDAVREFVPVGGLALWSVRVILRWPVETILEFRVSGRVPDADNGRPRPIEMVKPMAWVDIASRYTDPREVVRDLVREFVQHEADECCGFRRIERPSFKPGDPMLSQPTVFETVRPFAHRERA